MKLLSTAEQNEQKAAGLIGNARRLGEERRYDEAAESLTDPQLEHALVAIASVLPITSFFFGLGSKVSRWLMPPAMKR